MHEVAATWQHTFMSRAFVKEDHREELPVIPERAPLPEGTLNYVTPLGMEQLLAERAALEAERQALLAADDAERRRPKLHLVTGKLALLAERIASAQVIDPAAQSHDAVRFGATVTVETVAGEREGTRRTYQIVGVDEASATEGRIAFTSPLGRALLGREAGDAVRLRTPGGDEDLELVDVHYS